MDDIVDAFHGFVEGSVFQEVGYKDEVKFGGEVWDVGQPWIGADGFSLAVAANGGPHAVAFLKSIYESAETNVASTAGKEDELVYRHDNGMSKDTTNMDDL